MEIESYENNTKNVSKQEDIASKESLKYPSKFQLMLKVDLNYLIDQTFFNDLGRLKIIHELSNKNLGILLGGKLIFISPKSFREIKIIEPTYEERYSKYYLCRNILIDFIELNNSDIVIWTSNIFLIYDKEYNLKQKINEFEHGNLSIMEDYDYGPSTYYELNSICELKDGKLVSCNSYGLKFYEKDDNGKYKLISTEKMDVDVHFLVEIKPNLLILLQKHFDETFDDVSGDDKYLISIYNIETKNLEKIFQIKVFSIMGDFNKINYIYGNKYLYMCYEKSIKIFNYEKDVQITNIENDIFEYEKDRYGIFKRVMKKEKRIKCVLAYYYDNLFFGKILKEK